MTDSELAMSKTMTPEYVADAPIEPTQVDVSIGEEPGQEKPHEDAQDVADSLGCLSALTVAIQEQQPDEWSALGA